MTDDDFKVAFRNLDPVQPSASFASAVRSIPHRYPRPEKADLSLWQWFRLPSRIATLTTAALCGLGVGYLTLEQTPENSDEDLSAFLELDTHDSLFADSDDLDWGSL